MSQLALDAFGEAPPQTEDELLEADLFTFPDNPYSWTATPCDIQIAWEETYTKAEQLKKKHTPEIKELKAQLAELKGGKADVKQKRSMVKERLDLLLGVIHQNFSQTEIFFMETGIEFCEQVEERAKKDGLKESLMEEFTNDFQMHIHERCYQEHTWNLTLETIYRDILRWTKINASTSDLMENDKGDIIIEEDDHEVVYRVLNYRKQEPHDFLSSTIEKTELLTKEHPDVNFWIRKSVWKTPEPSKGYVQYSIRPYTQGYGCDGTTDSPIHLIPWVWCKRHQVDYVELYLEAYKEREGLDEKEIKAWLNNLHVTSDWETEIPGEIDTGLMLEDLNQINNRSIEKVLAREVKKQKTTEPLSHDRSN